MPYLNLHSTSGTDLVSPVTALGNNWDEIDTKFAAINAKTNAPGTGVVGPLQTMEFVSSETSPPNVAVYDGTTYQTIVDTETWGAWTTITLAANFNPVSGRTPQLRVSNYGHVQCRGAVQYQTGTTAWPAGWNLISSTQFAAATYAPSQVGVKNLTATPTNTTTWSQGQAYIAQGGGFLNLYLFYNGSTLASGNLICLDNLSWYR